MKLKLTTDKVLITGIVLLLLSTVTIMVVSISESRQVNDTAKLVAHTQEVLIHSGKLLSFAVDNESGLRGYLLTGQKVFLESLLKSQKEIHHQVAQLKMLTGNNPVQQACVDSLAFYINKRIAFSNHTIAVRELNGAEAAKAIVNTGEGRVYTNRLRQIINKMQSAENILLVQHKEANETNIVTLNRILMSVIVCVLILLGILIQKLRTDFSIKKKATALAKLNAGLEQRVLERTKEVVESKNVLDKTFERITDGFVMLDKNWRYTYMNKKAGKIFGRNPEQMIGKYIWAEFPDSISQPFYEAYHHAMEIQQYICLEEYYAPHGLWFENHIYPSPDGLSVFLRDVTERKKAELKIERANERFEMIAHATNDAVFELDLLTGESWHNEAFLRLFNSGISTGNVKPDIELWKSKLHPNDKERVINKLRTTFAGYSSTWADEFRFQKADSSYGTFYGRAFIARDESGKAVRMIGSMADITELKKVEEEIKRSNSQLTLSQQIAHVGYWEMDLINQSHYWSDELYHLFDLENDGTVMDLDTYMKNVHPDDRKLFLESHHAAIENNQQLNVEFRFVKKNGNICNFLTTGNVRTDKNGKPLRMEGTTQDITERKKNENEILKEKYLSDSIINSLPGVFYLYTRDGKFLRGNKNFETVTKYSADEIRKMHPLDLFDEDEREMLSQKTRNVFISGEENVQANFLLKTKDKIPYYFTGIAIEYEGSTCLMGVGIDISERVAAKEKIKKTSEQLRQLAGHLQSIREEERKRIGCEIHDELGQQLTAIEMDVAWIDKKIPEESAIIKNKLKNVITLLSGSNQSIRRILSELRPSILDDHDLLEAIEWLNRQFTANTGIPVKFTTDESEIKSSESVTTCIFRVYQEAFTNITRYAQAKKVSTSLSVANETIMVIIEDDGKGFDMASVQNKKSFGILGMQERILILGGSFELVSSPGKGTKIIIGLPYHTSEYI